MIKNIIFDVGKVLMAYEPDEYMEKLGFTPREREAVNQAMFQHPFWNESDRGALSSEELLEGFISHNPDYEKQIRQAYETVGKTITLMPHTLEWVKDLKDRGYRLYILSNYAEHTFEQTSDEMKFLPYMNGAVFSFQCKLIKPEQEIYRYLCEKYELVPEESIFLDDRQENVEAARAYGMQAIQVHSYEQASSQLNQVLDKE